MTNSALSLRQELEAPFHSSVVELYELDLQPLIAGLSYKEGRGYDPIRFDPDTGQQIVTERPADVELSGGTYKFYQPGTRTELQAMRKLRFCNDRNEKGEPVVFAGKSYLPYPIKVEGFATTGGGKLPRPVMTLANVTGVLTALAGNYDDLLGARLTRIRTFAKFLDAVNFVAGNAQADPNARLPDEIWVVDKKTGETRMSVTFELAAMLDLEGVMLPRRKIVSNYCTWAYRSDECGYQVQPGDAGFVPRQADDTAVPNYATLSAGEQLRLDVCGHRLTSCKLRYPQGALPFGGFPGANLYSR